MKTELIEVRTGRHEGVLDLTARCQEFAAGASGGGDGLLHVFVPHATAGLAVLEIGAHSDEDLLATLADLLPADNRWRHSHGSPGHGRSHVLPAFLAPFATLPVVGGSIALGTWQSILLVDVNVDNASRRVRLSFIG
ncbi:MAG TPA: YjbQ family protein [Streptosporangiaceae bacterium]|nr:YjbQ family protein [Streptosporangiaceae bacterium]